MPMMRAAANTGISRARITAACSNRSVNRLPLARPRHLDTLDPVIGAIRAGHLGRDIAVVLKEIQMAPGELAEVMRLARLAAVGAWEHRAAIGSEFDVQLVGALVRCRAAGQPRFQGGAIPRPRASASLVSIVHPSVAVYQTRRVCDQTLRNSMDSTWNVEETHFHVGLQSFRSHEPNGREHDEGERVAVERSPSPWPVGGSRLSVDRRWCVPATTQRLGWTTKPFFTRSDRLTISARSGRMPARAR